MAQGRGRKELVLLFCLFELLLSQVLNKPSFHFLILQTLNCINIICVYMHKINKNIYTHVDIMITKIFI